MADGQKLDSWQSYLLTIIIITMGQLAELIITIAIQVVRLSSLTMDWFIGIFPIHVPSPWEVITEAIIWQSYGNYGNFFSTPSLQLRTFQCSIMLEYLIWWVGGGLFYGWPEVFTFIH